MEVMALDKAILKQYTSLKKEIEEEERRIQAMNKEIERMRPVAAEVSDVVTKGKRGKKPLGTIIIHGQGDESKINRKRAQLRERKAKQEIRLSRLELMISDIEDFINAVEDSETRRIMRFFYLEGKTWNQAAEAMGEGYSGDACKKKVQREIKNL